MLAAATAVATCNAAENRNTRLGPSAQRLTQPTTRQGAFVGSQISPVLSPLPPAPQTPYPWIRRCHECGSEYPLAVTRRCLYCSHHFCTPLPQENIGPKSRRHRKKKKHCTAGFDYYGWAAWGAYRRSRSCDSGTENYDTLATWELTTESRGRNGRDIQSPVWKPLSAATADEVSRRKERMYVSGQYNCWLHCDFPSECIHRLHRARLSSGRETYPSSKLHDELQQQHENEQDKETRKAKGGKSKREKKAE
ncbi:hypothetical protein C8A01DRAFT_17042 [Parachaetomium inaequale]|uniref:Uncharacterized protein n=1 Tax=Parachaetomium inaequale TaxID=2588326 RepID=A0AAN6PH63_9PEZI|nr:hypothetical protein C8A01DRAFT_17042 [Parachaetomium inaequale]